MADEKVFVGVQLSRSRLNAARRQIIRDIGAPLPQKTWIRVLLELYADGAIEMRPEDLRKYAPEAVEKYELA